MQHFKSLAILATAGLCLVTPANAQLMTQPAYSDSELNTALGARALTSVVDTGCDPSCAAGNTATGYAALNADTTGSGNSAFGDQALLFNSTGSNNTAVGLFALSTNSTGNYNTAIGSSALYSDTYGYNNSATGYEALFSNSTGNGNTATGASALYSNTTGAYNVASGFQALYSNTTGISNVAYGVDALEGNTTGSNNVASGYQALESNSTGAFNVAVGTQALILNTTGDYNTASGYEALYDNESGQQNTASGVNALHSNRTGSYNTATGVDALYSTVSGRTNIGLGYKAGYYVTNGSNNIDIGSPGASGDNAIIRIGTQGTQIATYVAGISGVALTGASTVVSVNSNGQLGLASSSERFKASIAAMGSETRKLADLKPVTFHYKSEPHGPKQYGLVAEEVAKVFPDLVVRGVNGQILSVRYDELAPMLLNETQRQALEIHDLKEQQSRTQQQVADLIALNRNMALTLGQLQTAKSITARP